MYDPAIARWNAIDPLAEVYHNLNPYHYVSNNPLSFVDVGGYGQDRPSEYTPSLSQPDINMLQSLQTQSDQASLHPTTQIIDQEGNVIKDDRIDNGNVFVLNAEFKGSSANSMQELIENSVQLVSNFIFKGTTDQLEWYIHSQLNQIVRRKWIDNVAIRAPGSNDFEYGGFGVDAFEGFNRAGKYQAFQKEKPITLSYYPPAPDKSSFKQVIGNVYALRNSLSQEVYYTIQASVFPIYDGRRVGKIYNSEKAFNKAMEIDAIQNGQMKGIGKPSSELSPLWHKMNTLRYLESFKK